MQNFKPLFFYYFFTLQLLYSNDVAYSFVSSKQHLYLNEAMILEVNITQVDHSKVMLFKFSPQKSSDYEFHQIGFNEDEKYHDLQHQYTYLIYPKREGDVLVKFNMLKSITDDDKVAYSISGDRDNVKGLVKEDIGVALEPIRLKVKSPPERVDIIGDFTLTYSIDKKETEVYEPVNMNVILKGKGVLAPFDLIQKSNAYRLFTQKPTYKVYHSKEGTKSIIEWDYAISAEKSFTLPQKTLKAFNPESQKLYEITLPRVEIFVEEINERKLLDTEDIPAKAGNIDWSYFSTFLSYLIVFFAGWFMPREVLKFKKHKEESPREKLQQKINASKTHKEILQLLLLENNPKFSNAITALEEVVYNNKKKSLSEIKKMIL
jgi:hypothetical protein